MAYKSVDWADTRLNYDDSTLYNNQTSTKEEKKSNTKPKPRTKPQNLEEQLTLDEAKSGDGEHIMPGKIKDPRYPEPEWQKKEHIHTYPDGTKTNVHYWENIVTGLREGFKFK